MQQSPPRRGQIAALLSTLAIVAAPFIAYLARPEAGLVVMIAALLATGALLQEAAATLPPRQRRWARAAQGLNLGFAAACLVAVAWLIWRR